MSPSPIPKLNNFFCDSISHFVVGAVDIVVREMAIGDENKCLSIGSRRQRFRFSVVFLLKHNKPIKIQLKWNLCTSRVYRLLYPCAGVCVCSPIAQFVWLRFRLENLHVTKSQQTIGGARHTRILLREPEWFPFLARQWIRNVLNCSAAHFPLHGTHKLKCVDVVKVFYSAATVCYRRHFHFCVLCGHTTI